MCVIIFYTIIIRYVLICVLRYISNRSYTSQKHVYCIHAFMRRYIGQLLK